MGLVRCRCRPASSLAAWASTAFTRSAMSSAPMTFTLWATFPSASARPGVAVIVTSSWNPWGESPTARAATARFPSTWSARRFVAKPGEPAVRT